MIMTSLFFGTLGTVLNVPKRQDAYHWSDKNNPPHCSAKVTWNIPS